ncbi:cytochrome c3 family protein [Desulfococcaceae bacterium HSG8]|nr:cytochrome c3 family protein [Desulfococcaceae bacterium HSG8]
MKKIALLMVGIMLVVAVSVAEQNKGAEDMELFGGKQGNIPFPHHIHQKALKDCKICHDVFSQAPGSIEKLKAEGKMRKKQVMNKQCIACHKGKKKAKEKTGPTSCSKCHKKS